MEVTTGPPDFFGYALYHMFSEKFTKDPKFAREMIKWNKVIVFDTDYYPICISFTEAGVEIVPECNQKHDVRVKIKIETLIALLENKTSMIKAFLTGKMKFKKGLTKILKVKKLFGSIL